MGEEKDAGRLRARCAPVLGRAAEAMLPDHPRLDPAEQSQVLEDMQCFLVAQVFSMPRFLLVPFVVALAGFEWHTWPLRGSRFSRLDGDARAEVIRRWTRSRIARKRDLVKLIRSCALFYYLDHPLVRRRLERCEDVDAA